MDRLGFRIGAIANLGEYKLWIQNQSQERSTSSNCLDLNIPTVLYYRWYFYDHNYLREKWSGVWNGMKQKKMFIASGCILINCTSCGYSFNLLTGFCKIWEWLCKGELYYVRIRKIFVRSEKGTCFDKCTRFIWQSICTSLRSTRFPMVVAWSKALVRFYLRWACMRYGANIAKFPVELLNKQHAAIESTGTTTASKSRHEIAVLKKSGRRH